MSDPRYSPPASQVSDAKVGRPTSATVALALFALFVFAVGYRTRTGFELYATGEISGVLLLLKLTWVCVLAVILVLLAGRKHWVRWTLLAIALWEIYDLRWGIAEILGGGSGVPFVPLALIRWIAPAALVVAALVMVFGPAQTWFRPRRSN